MNREILFRGFAPDENGTEKVFVNGEWIKGKWVEGFLFKTQEHTYIAYAEQFDDDLFLSPKNIFVKVLPETVGQYTGLPDKNGKKIFEGGIVESRASENKEDWKRWIVTFYDGSFCFERELPRKRKHKHERNILCEDEVKLYGLVVIGNIHDNPELLEGEAE